MEEDFDKEKLITISTILRRHEASEKIRQAQQGSGRPIISIDLNDHRMIAVGNKLYHSNKWKTFNDFLLFYIKTILGPEWGNAEIAKPFSDRHPIMQWHDAFCQYQKAVIKTPGKISSAPITGVVSCYLGLAYSLYLIAHNVELQTRLVRRLKDPGNFQGAYYELLVSNVLIRAGFDLSLEDESDPRSKHCEFWAVSKRTGKRYSVEAKMRSVVGLLGRTERDGGRDDQYLARLGEHVNKSLAKPSIGERLIFVDVNGPVRLDKIGKPIWLERAMQRLERLEAEGLPKGEKAYVFVTNIAFHRYLNEIVNHAAGVFGLGMPEFGRVGIVKLIDAYRTKQKHIDAHDIGAAFEKLNTFPSTFDGDLPSQAYGKTNRRVIIGETYDFDGLIATVTTGCVIEDSKEAVIGVTAQDGRSHILKMSLSDDQLEDYRTCPEAYFGELVSVTQNAKNIFETFEWLMQTYIKTPKKQLADWLANTIDRNTLEAMSQEELALAYCERIAASMEAQRQHRSSSDSSSPID